MKEQSPNHLRIEAKLILSGIGLGVIFWILESTLAVLVFHEGNLGEQILSPAPHELWMRSLVIFLLIMFSVYAQFVLNKRKRADA